METLIKTAIRVGNSAGILLPKKWQGYEIKVILIDKLLNIKQDIIRILESYLQNIVGIYLAGSYARGEAEKESDIDVLVVTYGINKEIYCGKYHIILIDIEELKEITKQNITYYYPLIYEAKVILNKKLLEELKKLEITKNSLNWHIKTSKTAISLIKSLISIEKIEGNRYINAKKILYPLILRLREAYIVECILKNKEYSNKDFLNIVGKIVGKKKARTIYELYRQIRDNKKLKDEVAIEDIWKLLELLENIIEKQEKWQKEKRN